MRTGDSRSSGGPGILPLQHHYSEEFSDIRFPLHHRASLIAMRILGRKMTAPGKDVGHWVYDDTSVGDVLGFIMWLLDKQNTQVERKIPGWASVWPTQIKTLKNSLSLLHDNAKPGETIGVPISRKEIEQGMLPIRELPYDFDERFALKKVPFPRLNMSPDGKTLWPRHPIGTMGLAVGSTEHNSQKELFFHADPRLIAVNKKGEPDLSSWVYDITKENKYDPERRAKLHTLMRVFKRIGLDDGILALQMGLSGKDSLPCYGAVYFKKGTGNSPDDPIGLTSGLMSGYYSPGSGHKDKHFIDTTGDGNPRTSGHLATDSYFHKNATQDAPLKFERDADPNESSHPNRTKCHIVYGGNENHNFIFGPTRKGIWKVQAEVPFFPTYVPTGSTKKTIQEQRKERLSGVETSASKAVDTSARASENELRPVITEPTKTLKTAEIGDAALLRAITAAVAPPKPRVRPTLRESLEAGPLGNRGVSTGEITVPREKASGLVLPWSPEQGYQQNIITPQEGAKISTIWKPQQNFGRKIDLRFSHTPSKMDIDDYNKSSPAVLRAESFGDNNGAEWNYTEDNDTPISRYPGGTANGGLYFMPPELDISDMTAAAVRSDIPVSTPLVGFHSKVNQFFGTLIANPFSLWSGFLNELIASGGNFDRLISRYASGVKIPIFILGNDGKVGIYNAAGTYRGNFLHTGTDDREYRMLDKDYTFADDATVIEIGDTAGGDLSGTYPNPSVVDDSHNHTAATITGVLTAGLDADKGVGAAHEHYWATDTGTMYYGS